MVQKDPLERGGGETVKTVPHEHFGQVELCYDRFCARATTSEQAAAAIGGGMLGAVIGGLVTRTTGGVVAGSVLGALVGVVYSGSENGSSES